MENKIFLGKYRIVDSRYRVGGEVRRGLAGAAYEAQDVATGKKVAVELAPAASLRPGVRSELEAEALAAKKLRHINIPNLYDFGMENNQLIYVTESFDGTTTEEWVTANGPMPVDAVLRVALQVVGALGAAAFYKIFHHAINPRNLMIVPGQTTEGKWPLIKLIHLVGVAPTLAAADISMARFDNSASFASPEQLQQGRVDFRSEIFSLGCTLWFLLTGAAPFVVPGDPIEVAPTRMSLAVERLDHLPKDVRRLLGKMLAANPDERPLDPIALEEEIRSCLSEFEEVPPIIPGLLAPEPARAMALPIAIPARRRFPKRAVALAAVFLVLATLAVTALPERFRPIHFSSSKAGSEPIGVPIGIPEASIAPDSRNAAGSNLQPVSTDHSLGRKPETSVAMEKPVAPPETTPPPAVVASEVAATPVPSTAINPPANESSAKRPAPLVANKIPAVKKHAEPAAPAEAPSDDVATAHHNERTAAPQSADAASSSDTLAHHTGRAEPVPPAEAPVAEPATSDSSSAVASTDNTNEDNETAAPAPTILPDPPTKSGQATSSKSRSKSRSIARSWKKRSHKRPHIVTKVPQPASALLQTPRGVVRARVIGTTPNGDVVLSLPSHHVVVLPPPPEF